MKYVKYFAIHLCLAPVCIIGALWTIGGAFMILTGLFRLFVPEPGEPVAYFFGVGFGALLFGVPMFYFPWKFTKRYSFPKRSQSCDATSAEAGHDYKPFADI